MKIGVIWVGFNCEDTLERSLAPWIEARKSRLDGHEFVICTVSVPFEGFGEEATDKTRTLLGFASTRDDIDHAIVRDKPMKETDARGAALRWLVEQGATHLWQVDADENYTTAQITGILRFVEGRPADWYRLCLKNQVFTPNQYLVEPFTPPRIHRVYNPGGFVAAGFHQDNNVYHERPWNGERAIDDNMASLTVPKGVAWIDHAAWISNERSKKKVEYQLRRWGICSYKWDYEKNKLLFDEEFYRSRGLHLPETEFSS